MSSPARNLDFYACIMHMLNALLSYISYTEKYAGIIGNSLLTVAYLKFIHVREHRLLS